MKKKKYLFLIFIIFLIDQITKIIISNNINLNGGLIMAYYAPFYRPTYYDPVQQNPMGQFNQQFQQPVPQQMQPLQTSQQSTNDFLWVLNENEATSYPVAPNNTVTLWDKNLPTIYIKSVNAQGVPSMRILDFTERDSTSSKMPSAPSFNSQNNFVTIDRLNALKCDVEALRGKLDELNAKPAAKSKKTEVENRE